MPTTVTIQRSDVRSLLFAESTNASRTFTRNDGVSEFDKIVIDEQVDQSLDGSWMEAKSKLEEKMQEFISSSLFSNYQSITFRFKADAVPAGLTSNIKMYIVDYMMQDWLVSVRPDYRQRYIDRANFEMDDLLRKLYKKEPPV